MKRRTTLAFLLASVLLLPAALANYGSGDVRLTRLYADFIAPCCWSENLTTHSSPAANEVRARIKTLIQEGQTDAQIKAALVDEHGPRILTLPEGRSRLWLFWMPVAALGLGLAVLMLVVKRQRRTPRQELAGVAPAELEDGWDRD